MQRGQAVLAEPKGLFTSYEEQLDLVRQWNRERKWGFTEEDFAPLCAGPPEGKKGRLIVDVLEVALPDGQGLPGIVRTFREMLSIAFSPFAGGACWDGFDRLRADTLRVSDGLPYVGRRLLWERIDLGACRGTAPGTFGGEKLPGLCVLAASALHPRWVAAMDGGRVPYVWLAGIDVTLDPAKPWSAKPRMGFSQPTREVRLHAIESWRSHQCWAVPRYV